MNHLDNDLQSHIDAIRSKNEPRERIPTKRRKVEFKFGDQSLAVPDNQVDTENEYCAWCNLKIEFNGCQWRHVGLAQPRHPAMTKEAAKHWASDDLTDVLEDEQRTPTINPPHLTKGVQDVYRVLRDALTPGQKILLQSLWELACEDSRMLDWLEQNNYKHHHGDGQWGFTTLKLLDMMQTELRPLREAIKERMNPKAPDADSRTASGVVSLAGEYS